MFLACAEFLLWLRRNALQRIVSELWMHRKMWRRLKYLPSINLTFLLKSWNESNQLVPTSLDRFQKPPKKDPKRTANQTRTEGWLCFIQCLVWGLMSVRDFNEPKTSGAWQRNNTKSVLGLKNICLCSPTMFYFYDGKENLSDITNSSRSD